MIAVIREEPGCWHLTTKMESASGLAIGAPTAFETSRVALGRFGHWGRIAVERFVEDWAVEIQAFETDHARTALDAFARYGKGRHPARLNYGDCMAYATARVAGLPLLFVGEDFVRTDIESA